MTGSSPLTSPTRIFVPLAWTHASQTRTGTVISPFGTLAWFTAGDVGQHLLGLVVWNPEDM